jgi:hypothetical protein
VAVCGIRVNQSRGTHILSGLSAGPGQRRTQAETRDSEAAHANSGLSSRPTYQWQGARGPAAGRTKAAVCGGPQSEPHWVRPALYGNLT